MTQVALVGRLGADPELRFTPNGKAVANFSLAVQERRFDNGAWVDGDTSWYRVAAWQRLAENVVESLHTGDLVVVVGKQQVRQYEKDGQTRTSVDVTAEHVAPSLLFATATVVKTMAAGPKQTTGPASDPDEVPF